MSKVFEEEYKQLAESDIPDLWERIEAGLNDKTVEPVSAPKIKVVKYVKYAGLAAACLCAIALIPAILPLTTGNKSGEYPAADMAAPASEAAYEMAADEAPAMETEAEAAGMLTEAADAIQEEAASVNEAERLEGAAEEKQSLNDISKTTLASEVRETTQAAYEGILADGTLIKGATLQIISAETAEDITVYCAIVTNDPSSQLLPNSQITFTKAPEINRDIIIDETYQVNLQYNAASLYLFEVTEI